MVIKEDGWLTQFPCSGGVLLISIIRRRNFWVMLSLDVLLLGLAYMGAYWLRFDGGLDREVLHAFWVTLGPLIICMISSFLFFDLYRGMWRYTSVRDLANVIKGSLVGTVLFVAYLAMFHHFSGISRAVVVADGVFTVVAIGGLRLGIRLYFHRDPEFLEEISFWKRKRSGNGDQVRALILGTGPSAERLLREVMTQADPDYKVVGLVDTVGTTMGMKIHGMPILGSIEDLPEVISLYRADEVLIALSGKRACDIKTAIEKCTGSGIRFKVIPSITDRINGAVTDKIRDIQLEDLLEREPVELDMSDVSKDLEAKIVMVTGAGGSIGSELARQILTYNPSRLILLDNAETPLFNIDMELKKEARDTEVIASIGDIRSTKGLERIFKAYRPEIVYHAAAYKHVPMMELNPIDAVNNNILGTYKLASVSLRYHVRKFVLISTDKAVRPTSVMGATKRVSEMIVQSMNGNGTGFVVVRFGNVIGSNGSVVPLFESQIASGGPVTVTHPEVTRYFMTIPEAVMLVLKAGAMGKGGELFLLDMGEPVKIVDLARNMIRLAGLVPDKDIKIEFIGLRPGEKLYEELLIDGEGIVDTAHGKIKVYNNADGIDEEVLFEAVERFRLLVESSGDNETAINILKRLVPSYHIEEIGFVSIPGTLGASSLTESDAAHGEKKF